MASRATAPYARSSLSGGFGFRTSGRVEGNRRNVGRVELVLGGSRLRNRPSLWLQLFDGFRLLLFNGLRNSQQTGGQRRRLMRASLFHQVASEKPSNSALVDTKTEASVSNGNNGSATSSIITEPLEISGFMIQVSDLVKLVDSKDIMELQLKQLDFEITVRKKEAIQQPIVAAPVPQAVYPSFASPSLPITALTPAPSAQVTPKVPALPTLAKSSGSAHPPLKCPMAGTFYRSPAPGEPPFVKVGDKVQKGQVVCIIDAMKLMNEIEADQSGTVVEVLVEDGKPPLLVILP